MISSPRFTSDRSNPPASVINTIFASFGLTRAIIEIVSAKFGSVVGSASPLSAMSFNRSRSRGTDLKGSCCAISPERIISSMSRNSSFRDNQIEILHGGLGRAVHLAINTVEIARLVRIDVQPDGNAMTAPREDRIDVLEVLKAPRMLTVCRKNCHAASLAAADHKSQPFTRVGGLRRDLGFAQRLGNDGLKLRSGCRVIRRQKSIIGDDEDLIRLEFDPVQLRLRLQQLASVQGRIQYGFSGSLRAHPKAPACGNRTGQAVRLPGPC